MPTTTTPGLLHRDRTIAGPGFSRWMVPPAALCVHLCIGQAYAFSVFNLPMTKLIGITKSAPDDWKLTDLGWIFSIGIVFLGLSAAVMGRWVEEGGPRRAMFTSALLWSGGFMLSAFGVSIHNIPCSRDNPVFDWVDYPEIVGDFVAVCAPVAWHLVTQECEHGDAEILETRVAPVVGDVAMHQPP